MLKRICFFICSMLFLFTQKSKANLIIVGTNAQLYQAIKTAKPNDSIVLQKGIWQNCNIEISANGTANLPITILANTLGDVVLKGKCSIRIGGNFIIIKNLQFTDGQATSGSIVEFRSGKQVANNSRLTNCSINSFNNFKRTDENYWLAVYGKNNRIDHCTFNNKLNLGVLLAVILDDDRSRLNNHSIDSNFFNARKPLASNSGEIIRVGVSQHCTFYSNTIIRDNLFEHCDGETEIISIKSCGNLVRNNIFKECQGTVVLRHGNNNTIEGNIFLGNNKKGSGGVRIINEGNWVVNNLFYKCRGEGFRSPMAFMNGVFNSPANRYLPVKDAVIANNTFFKCSPISFCEGSDTERSVAPKNVYFFSNSFVNNADSMVYNVYDKMDGFYFKNNVLSKNYKQKVSIGFEKKIEPIYDIKKVNKFKLNSSVLPDSLAVQAKDRLVNGLSAFSGFSNWALYNVNSTLYLKNYGCSINKKLIQQNNNQSSTNNYTIIKCSNATEIYAALEQHVKGLHIQLTGNAYQFNKPIQLKGNIIFSGLDNKSIEFSTSTKIPCVFYVQAGSNIQLNQLHINGAGINCNSFIITDSSANGLHYNLKLRNNNFTNFTDTEKGCAAFFVASISSIADSIVVSNNTFESMASKGFMLNNEIENKGYYSVENIVFSNNYFKKNSSELLNLYRGGNDESTMGPNLVLTQNVFQNCNAASSLIILSGVQQSSISKNIFTHCNANTNTIIYKDWVRAKHLLNNNQFIKSGSNNSSKFLYQISNTIK